MKSTKSKIQPSSLVQFRLTLFGVSRIERLFSSVAVMGLLACGTGVANANDLFNPDLDVISVGPQVNASPDGWQIVATKSISGSFTDGADSEPWCNFQQPGGWGLFYKPFQGSTNANPNLDDLLSVYFYQDNSSSPGTKYTLSGYACGQANYSGYQVSSPNNPATGFYIAFLDAGGNGIITNKYDLIAAGLSNAGDPVPVTQFTTPQFTAPAGTVTVRAGAYMLNVWSTTGGQSLTMDAFDLESVAPPGSPIITNQPTATTVAPGGTAQLTVGISNPTGATYTWTRNGATLSDSPGHISGSATKTLTILGASSGDAGHYQAQISNAAGLVRSRTVPLALSAINFFPVVTLTGTIGDTYEVDYTTSLLSPNWIPLAVTKLVMSPQLFIDSGSPGSNTRFYRELFLY